MRAPPFAFTQIAFADAMTFGLDSTQIAFADAMTFGLDSQAHYVEDMTRFSRRVDLRMAQDKKLHHLLRGIEEELFSGLEWSPPKTIVKFMTEAVAIEKMVQQRSSIYDRQINSVRAADILSTTGTNDILRELIPSVVREELQNAGVTAHVTSGSIAAVIKEELHQALRGPSPPKYPRQLPLNAAVRRPPMRTP